MPSVVNDPNEEIMFKGSPTDTFFVNLMADEIYSALENDPEFLLQFFLGDQLTKEVPVFHVDILKKMTAKDLKRLLLCIPRGHAKTTLAKLAVIWYYLFSAHRFCVYLSNTSGIAKNCCRDIVNFLKCDNFIATFGMPKFEKESENEGLWIFWLTLPNGTTKRCILRAVGAGQQTRGINVDNQRPDIAIIDDLEDKENTKTEAMQKNLDDWMYGTFLKSLDKFKSKVIWLGNMLRKTSLLARLSKRKEWHPIVYGCLIKNPVTGKLESLWPDLWPVEEIKADFAEYASLGLVETWMCEMMNMPGSGKNGFKAEQFNYCQIPSPDSEQILGTFITIDPAFGEKAVHDNTGIVVHAIMESGITLVVDYRIGKFREHEIFSICCGFSYLWNSWFWGIESVAAQAVLLTLFQVYAIQDQVHELLEMDKLTAGTHKSGRIQAWVSSMTKEVSGIPEADIVITNQLLAYDPENKVNDDDLIDSCAYQSQMLDRYRALILQRYVGNLNASNDNGQPQIRYGADICP